TASRSARVAKTWRASPPPASPCVAAADRLPGRSRGRRAGAAVHHAARGTAYTRAMTTLLSRTGAWRMAFPACALALCTALALPASAQRYELDLSQLDPAAVMSLGDEVLLRAPDPAIDRLFKAVHASSRSDTESAALCALFEPEAARDVAAFQRAVGHLGDASRERFALAFTDIAIAGLQ